MKVPARQFNGPAGVEEVLRIAMTKEAYADLIGHAKESLDREICGVLLGDLCEDEYGRFLDIEAALRGGAAKTGGTHVTFTQETWNEIHTAKEQRFPQLQIVGWYHSHPGFGVAFSDMDLFIQKNFFGGPGQIAFVSDPLGGQEAIVANADGEIRPVKRFWVDGRERRCYVPKDDAAADENRLATPGPSADLVQAVHDLQDRVRQLTEAAEKERGTFFSFLTFLGMLAAFCFILAAGYSIFRSYQRPIVVPEEMAATAVPVMLDGKLTAVSLSIKGWAMSPEVEDEVWKYLLAKHTPLASTQPATAPATAPATQAAAAMGATTAH